MFRLISRLAYLVLWVAFPLVAAAQALPPTTAQQDTLPLPFMKRFSIRTNAVDWFLATPNLGVELDLSGSPKTRFSVLVNGKWNWNTSHNVSPRIIYNVAAGSVEARKYWRTGGKWRGQHKTPYSFRTSEDLYKREKSGVVGRDTTVSLPRWAFQVFRRNVLSGRTFENARIWRAYYAGVYAGYEKYTIAMGRTGKQGDSYNFGFSGGWSVPLYPFKDGRSVDLDLGLALGAKMTEYDEFGYEEETACYVYQGTKGRHFVPYPVLQDIHVSLIFRFRSISKKVKGGYERYDKWEREVYDVKKSKRDSIRNENWYKAYDARKTKRIEQKRDSLHNDSIRQKYREKQQLDSIQRVAKKAEVERVKEATKKAAEAGKKVSGKKAEKEKKVQTREDAEESGKTEKKDKKKKRKQEEAPEARIMRETAKETERYLAMMSRREESGKEEPYA